MAVVQVSFNWILNFLLQFAIESTSTWIFCRCFYRSPQCHPGQQFCPWCLWWGSAWSSRSASCWWSASSAIYVLLEMVFTLWPDRDTKTSWGTGVTLQWTGIQYVWHFPDALNHKQQYKVNRCLARYSLRATTTNQPTNRAPNEPAMNNNAKFGHFWAKNPNFYWRNQMFCSPPNGSPT